MEFFLSEPRQWLFGGLGCHHNGSGIAFGTAHRVKTTHGMLARVNFRFLLIAVDRGTVRSEKGLHSSSLNTYRGRFCHRAASVRVAISGILPGRVAAKLCRFSFRGYNADITVPNVPMVVDVLCFGGKASALSAVWGSALLVIKCNE